MSAHTTASVPAATAAGSWPASAAFDVEPAGSASVPVVEQRGRLVLADKVVAKIAGQAAAEVTGTAGRSGGVFGIGDSADSTARPKVQVQLGAESADLSIQVGVTYPGSIRQAAQQIRERVVARVQELTGVAVHRVDIDITFLTVTTDATDGAYEQRGPLR